MESMNLREAADRTCRSITTLRRYIRAGRLRAELRDGRYGPEWFVTEDDLACAGLEPDDAPPLDRRGPPAVVPASVPAPAAPADGVPIALFRELQMKHEQLLVQYGMFRASGLRATELQDRLAEAENAVQAQRAEIEALRDEIAVAADRYERERRAAELELHGRALEIEALRAKIRGLELLTRNVATTEDLDAQITAILGQARRIEPSSASRSPTGRRSWTIRRAPVRPPEDH